MATVINIKNLPEGFQSIITNGKHSIIGDEPIASKGTDLGMSPSELVLSGLALCKAGTVRYIARKKGWEIGEVKAQLTQKVKKSDGQLITFIKVAIEIEGNISKEQKTELLQEADNCYIHRQLNGEWEIDHATEIIENAESVLQ